MKRVPTWPKELKAVIEKHLKLPSQFGVSDCYLIVHDAVFAMTGEHMYPAITYTSEQGAAKLLLQHGFKTVEEAFAAKFETVHPAMAQRGDIGVIDDNSKICGGFFSSHGFVARGEKSLLFLPPSRVKTAFKVAR